jgi:SAM-dependent methyltransferase
VSCPLCGDGREARHVLRAHGTDLVRCRRCRLVRIDPMPEAEALLAQYDGGYFADGARGYVDYVADEAVYRAEFRRRLRVIRAAGGRGVLLDVGCASGALLAEAGALGFDARGLEPAEDMARRAAERTGRPVHAGSLDDALLAPVSFDVVTLFDVLEHVPDPVRALRKLRIALRPGGLLALTVPDFGGWWARLAGARWPFITPWEHVLYFTRRTLALALREAGFVHVRFAPACTPVSFVTAAAKGPLPARWIPRALAHRGIGLPAGTLFALADAPAIPERAPRPASARPRPARCGRRGAPSRRSRSARRARRARPPAGRSRPRPRWGRGASSCR